MDKQAEGRERRVAVMVDCDNVPPAILEDSLRIAAQFGRIVLRRAYGTASSLVQGWQQVLMLHAFTPCLQFAYAAGKNTSDIALALDALEALCDGKAEVFCLITSDSDFATLARKLRERDGLVCLVGEAKAPQALRNAGDEFFEWAMPKPDETDNAPPRVVAGPAAKRRPQSLINAVTLLAGDSAEGTVTLSALGQYLKRTDPAFSPKSCGHRGCSAWCGAMIGYRCGRRATAPGWWASPSLPAPPAPPADKPDRCNPASRDAPPAPGCPPAPHPPP